jgi:peptide chain release factor 2
MTLLSDLIHRLGLIKNKLNYSLKRQQLSRLQLQSRDEQLWNNPTKAQEVLKETASCQKLVSTITYLEDQITTLQELQCLLQQSPDSQVQDEINTLTANLEADLQELEIASYLSAKYDINFAILSIHAGQGGTEAMDWVQMLHRMYLKYFDKKKWPHQVVDTNFGEEAGIKSVYIKISHDYAYGYLKHEAGVHRLVRLSPFNAHNLRQTSFAKVEVTPIIATDSTVNLRPEDIVFKAYRSGGHGGQNVNKVSTAVRLLHRPTGLVVSCQSQRSQEKNRLLAQELLYSQLWSLAQGQRLQEQRQLKGDYVIPGWGRQIRSYILHPYQMVKDLRTEHQTSDSQAVLDGDLDEFINSQLKILS